MLADAYKIASDIKNAMPALRSDSMTIPSRSVVASFKSKIKTLLPQLKYRLSLITRRLDNYIKNDLVEILGSYASLSLKHVTSVNDCMLEMVTFFVLVIENADVYRGSGRGAIYRDYTPPGQYSRWIYAHQDIDYIDKAAIKCIDSIAMPK